MAHYRISNLNLKLVEMITPAEHSELMLAKVSEKAKYSKMEFERIHIF